MNGNEENAATATCRDFIKTNYGVGEKATLVC